MKCEHMSIWCWLIPLLVGLISAIVGYYLGKRSKGNTEESIYLNQKVAKLEADLKDCKGKLSTKGLSAASTSSSIASSFASGSGAKPKAGTTAVTFDADAAKAVFGKKIKQDDLKIVEGIGPKIEQLFHSHNVKTWKDLSECSVDKCKQVLSSGGDRYKIHKPGTWPDQAKLAYEGKWKALLKWQDELDGGK